MSTNNLCFGAKIRKIGIPLQTPVFLYKSGVYGVYISRTCFPDVKNNIWMLYAYLLANIRYNWVT